MKRLLLIRHAKSSWKNADLPDAERPLNKRGQKDAPRMAKRLKEKRIFPDVILCGPAVRTKATCEVFCELLNFDLQRVQYLPELYHASETTLLRVVRQVKDTADRDQVVLIFGHNPGLTDFANLLFDEEIENVPTCGVVCGEVKAATWNEVKPGCGTLDFFDYPKRKKHS